MGNNIIRDMKKQMEEKDIYEYAKECAVKKSRFPSAK